MYLRDNTVFIPVAEPNMSPERTNPERLPVAGRIASFDEIEHSYSEEEALMEASRCLKCPTHWCEKACPAHVPVTDFIAKVRAKDYEAAYQLIRTASSLPEICSRVCPHEKQCQSNCTRGIRTQAVGIDRLERFVVEQHYANYPHSESASPSGKSVAVIGSGPSGLSVAQQLANFGHAVTVFEKADRPGGLLAYGIPNMKLKKGVLDRKISSMESQGVTFVCGTNIDSDFKATSLIKDFDAVVLAVGAKNPRLLSLPGSENAQGIYTAVDYLSVNTKAYLNGCPSEITAYNKDVVIIGGGDTGSDCVGTSIRNGCRSVVQIEILPKSTERKFIYDPRIRREPEQKVDASMEESIFQFGKDPHRYQTTVKSVQTDQEGHLCSVSCVSLKPYYDEHFRLHMEEIPGTEEVLPCQMLVVAAGFLGPESYVSDAFGVDTSLKTTIATENYVTSREKVFACGDCRTGQSLVVKAMVDGIACAKAVDDYLKNS